MSNWVSYFVLGKSQYHMHFLPTLFCLFLFYPVMRLATRFPMLGLTLFATLGAMNAAQGYIWSLDMDPLLRDYVIRFIKIFGYVGYSFAAFALYGLWNDGIPRGESKLIRRGSFYFAAMAYLATLPYYGNAIVSGSWGYRSGWDFYGHFLMPVFMLLIFMGGQYREWSPIWSKGARYTLVVYLIHPMVIDLYDIAVVKLGISGAMDPWMIVTTRYAFALPMAFVTAIALSRFKPLAWTIGLGPTPWNWGKQTTKAEM